MRAERSGDNWQSFADIAMGLMAVLLLVLVIVVREKASEAEQKADEARKLNEFAVELLDALSGAQEIIVRQEGVGEWVSEVFKQTGCSLEYDPVAGTLKPRSGAAELYESGETQLSADALRKLDQCGTAFMVLAGCMSPDDRRCPKKWREWREARAFRDDIEALVLQGNTDREPYSDARPIEVDRETRKRRRGRKLRATAKSFVGNADLGAERARQALGHLLFSIEPESEGDAPIQRTPLHTLLRRAGARVPSLRRVLYWVDPATGASDLDEFSPLQAFLRRASIESPSFGRYQAGMMHERDVEGQACGDRFECQPARNLSLQLRWKRKSLRKPFEEVRRHFCEEWQKEGSQLAKSLSERQHRRKVEKLCGEVPQ